MKKAIILFLAIAITVTANSQTTKTAAQLKQDSIEQAENTKFIQDVQSKATVKDLNEWFFNNVPAKFYSDFVQMYNEFLKMKLIEWRNKKK